MCREWIHLYSLMAVWALVASDMILVKVTWTTSQFLIRGTSSPILTSFHRFHRCTASPQSAGVSESEGCLPTRGQETHQSWRTKVIEAQRGTDRFSWSYHTSSTGQTGSCVQSQGQPSTAQGTPAEASHWCPLLWCLPYKRAGYPREEFGFPGLILSRPWYS